MHRDPLEFTLRDGELIPGFEKAVLGMNPGDTKTATFPAEQAYGAHWLEMVIEVDRQHLPPTLQPYVGQRLQMTQQDGTPVPVFVMVVTDAQVTLNANHPLAGKDLIPPPAFQATPPALPYPILQRLSSTSQSRAAPRAPPGSAALRRAAAAGVVKKGVWLSYNVGRRAPTSDKDAGSVNLGFYGYYALQGGSSSWDSPQS
jgi:peptidylprolyl isomerase